MSLTQRLLSSYPDLQQHATEHQFLKRAGAGDLPSNILCAWLVQDVHYTRSYIRFVGGLLSKLEIPVGPNVFRNDDLHARVYRILSAALGVIGTEVQFFEDTAKNYELPLKWDAEMEHATKEYKELFEAKGVSNDAPLLDGLVLLWATEYCYFKAWTHALQNQSDANTAADDTSKGAVAALHKAFIPNWTNDQFGMFVEECASVADAVAEKLEGDREAVFERCQKLFKYILELETSFWPTVS